MLALLVEAERTVLGAVEQTATLDAEVVVTASVRAGGSFLLCQHHGRPKTLGTLPQRFTGLQSGGNLNRFASHLSLNYSVLMRLLIIRLLES